MGRVFCKVPRRKRNRRDGTILGGRGMRPQQQSTSWRSERPRRLRSADRQDPCARPRSGQPGSHPQCRTDSLAGGMAGFLSGQPFPDKRWPDPTKPGSCCERLLGLPEPREGRKGGRRRPPGERQRGARARQRTPHLARVVPAPCRPLPCPTVATGPSPGPAGCPCPGHWLPWSQSPPPPSPRLPPRSGGGDRALPAGRGEAGTGAGRPAAEPVGLGGR